MLNRDDFNETDVAKKLLYHIKSEKGYFEGRIEPDDLASIVCAKAKQTNSRIKSQSGAFLLFGHDATLPETGQDGLEVSRISIVEKQSILKQLDSININATTVYPSIRTVDKITLEIPAQTCRSSQPSTPECSFPEADIEQMRSIFIDQMAAVRTKGEFAAAAPMAAFGNWSQLTAFKYW